MKFHLSNIYRKLGVSNRTQASRWAVLQHSGGMPLMTGYRTQASGFDSPPDDRRSARTRPNGRAQAAIVRHQAEELQDATATLSLVAGLGLAGIALMVVIDLLIARTL